MQQHTVESEILAVTHLHTFLEELKNKAQQMLEVGGPVQRGFFTPDEDEQVRCLLISYCQTRSALFELILGFRQQIGQLHDAQPGEFLVPFSAALLLIDAARFLRKVAEDRPLVRRKLNEPAPEFGIEEGTYDAIQQSLLSARHAWHLYHAIQFYDEHEKAYRQLAKKGPLAPVVAIIERLREQVDVAVTQFARAKLRTRSDQWLRQLGRGTILRPLYGLQKLVASLMADRYVRPGHSPQIPKPITNRFQQLLQPGDVLLVRKEYAVTNYFLPGYWPHVALYLGSLDELRTLDFPTRLKGEERWDRLQEKFTPEVGFVLESMKDGVHFRSLQSPFASDSVAVIRPRMARDELVTAIARGVGHEGKPYDFDFDFFRSDRLVCTEVVYRAYEGVGAMRFQLTQRAGRLNLSGNDLIHMSLRGEHFDPVAVFFPDACNVMEGESAATAIRETVGE